jgi:hypothetical protein
MTWPLRTVAPGTAVTLRTTPPLGVATTERPPAGTTTPVPATVVVTDPSTAHSATAATIASKPPSANQARGVVIRIISSRRSGEDRRSSALCRKMPWLMAGAPPSRPGGTRA